MRKPFKIALYSIGALAILLAIGTFVAYRYASASYEGPEKRIYISADATPTSISNMLNDSLGTQFGSTVYRLWSLRDGTLAKAHGSYRVRQGESAMHLASRLRGGMQDPVKVTVPNLRSYSDITARIASNFDFSAEQLSASLDSTLTSHGVARPDFISIILPDSYEFYWSATPDYVAEYFYSQWEKFWNEVRRTKAGDLGLTPAQVSTLASIVEEETAKRDERPLVARLYLNRLDRHMRLQADPTVKYALGDPTLRRILNTHLSTPSPYNTYIIDGLPPGAIRMVDKQTIDAVLDAPRHNYLYMCAREDFSGYHNFASTLSAHNANAARYHAALNKHNIR